MAEAKGIIEKFLEPVNLYSFHKKGNVSLLSYMIARLKFKLHYWLGFENSHGLKNNFLYNSYHEFCKRHYKRLNSGVPNQSFKDKADSYIKNGFHLIPPDEEFLKKVNSIPESLLAKMDDTRVADGYPPNGRVPKNEFATRYYLTKEDLPSVLPLISEEVDGVLKAIYQSYYMISSVYFFRTEPSDQEPRTSWLWHLDEHPNCHIKVYYYLTDTYKNNGSLQTHNMENSKKIKRKGFLDRRNIPKKLLPMINDEKNIITVEGKRGTIIIFWPSTVHRAVIPKEKRRDVIVFEMIPSPSPNLIYAENHLKFWDNPFDVLFNSLAIQTKMEDDEYVENY